uniref:ATP synthase F0 subunit 8 n=1 Tax=Dyscolus oreas TaxID=3027493 RepID=UPI0023D7FEBD|nr:ATP synthase F0 subunit 8 [Dyscolus oreas]WCS91654.1 ATP synthase F0 subunit 8 [Dyscolus oreas]WCS91667.1 ATP synthase F0 subunit 8 [Dyscolus oreas]
MPQMAPMNWLFLYLMFTFIFFLFNFLNYYMFLIKNIKGNLNNNFTKKFLNWKW